MSASREALDGSRGRRSSVTSLCANERRVDNVFRDEPHLQFVSPDDVADQQVVGPIVARLRGATSHRAGFLDHDFVRVKQTRDLDRRLFAPAGRPRDERRLGDVVRHRDADTAEQLDTFRDRIDELVLLGGQLGRWVVAAGRPRHLPVISGLMFLVGLAGSMFLLAAATSGAMAVVAVLIGSIAFGGWAPAYYTQMSMLTSPAHRGQAYAWSTIWSSLGGLVAAPLVGRIGDLYGQRIAVVTLGLLVVVAGVLALWISPVMQRDVDATREALAVS